MRKVLWIILAVIALAIAALIVTIAISGTPEHFPMPAAPTATAEVTPAPTPTPVPTPAPTPVEYAGVLQEQDGQLTYYFQNYALQIPEAWQGLFDYETWEDGAAFYSKRCRDAGYSGLLCWISPTMTMRQEEIEVFYDGVVLGEQDSCYYILTTPIDQQFDPENEAAAAEYEKMQGAIGLLAESFAFTQGEPQEEPF